MYIENSSVFDSLFNELQDIIKNVETPIKILEVGVKEFVNDLLKLTKPYSKISASDYTHLVDTFSYEIVKNEIEVCWGKYYGRMVEDGTKLTPKEPHLVPLFEKNKEKYYEKMTKEIYK